MSIQLSRYNPDHKCLRLTLLLTNPYSKEIWNNPCNWIKFFDSVETVNYNAGNMDIEYYV